MPKVTLSNATTFNCQPEQTLLETARALGISLEHSCRTGRCGVCKARVLDGTTNPIKVEESLGADEQAAGFILTCCRSAVTDVTLDIEDLGELGNIETRTLPSRIDSLTLLSDDVIEVTLRTPPANRLAYLPGQYIDVIGRDGLRRSYSIANAPRDDGKITLQIRKVQNGEISRYWSDEAKANDPLRLEGPLGTFCLRSTPAAHHGCPLRRTHALRPKYEKRRDFRRIHKIDKQDIEGKRVRLKRNSAWQAHTEYGGSGDSPRTVTLTNGICSQHWQPA